MARILGTEEPGGLPSIGSHSRTRLKSVSKSLLSQQQGQTEFYHSTGATFLIFLKRKCNHVSPLSKTFDGFIIQLEKKESLTA